MGEIVPPSPGLTILQTFLDTNPSVEFIQCLIMDYSSVLRVRVATKHFALSLAAKSSPISVQSPILTAALVDGSIMMEDMEIGGDEMWPDWSSLRILPYQPGHAQVMCFVKETGIWDGKGFKRCQRTRLLELTDDVNAKHGIEFLVGIEIEFYIMEASKDVLPATPVKTNANAFSAASLRNEYLPILEEIVRTLGKVGILVRQFHTEGGSGFFEISTEPLPPLQAADALIYSQEAIKTICFKHGLHATMHPKPFEKLEGAGLHMHLSMSKTEKEESFLAGLLEHWAPLAAFYMPGFDSYTRVSPGQLVWWGKMNRSAALRKIKSGHWELRAVDGTANLYLTLFAILTAGLLGFESSKVLEMKDPLKIMWKGIEGEKGLDPKKAEEFGIKEKFATTLKDALELLKSDEPLTKALGPEIVGRYLKVKAKEEENFNGLIGSERREKTVRLF